MSPSSDQLPKSTIYIFLAITRPGEPSSPMGSHPQWAAHGGPPWPKTTPGVTRPPPAGCDRNMADKPMITHPLLRLGRLQLNPRLRALQPGSAASGLVATATLPVPEASADRHD